MVKFSKAKAFDMVSEAEATQLLLAMENDERYSTAAQYAVDSLKYPSNSITFTQRHIEHLRKFPEINPHQYISNLKLMTKVS